MNISSLSIKSVLSLAIGLSLSACGGGGDVAANATAFSVSPSEIKITSGNASCTAVDIGASIHTVVGGTPPYRIVNSAPDRIYISHTNLDGKNPTFQMRALGGCGEYAILVLDYHSRTATLTVEVEKPEEE